MNQQQELVEIGRGNCGSVWARRLSEVEEDDSNSKIIIKREDCNRNRSVTKEYDIHKHILARLAAATMASKSDSNLIIGYQVNIPIAIDFIDSTSPEWASLLPHLPKDFKPCKALKNERIPPMRQHVRQLLAQKYCGTGGRSGLLSEKLAAELLYAVTTEQNCLVRPFLGRRRLPRNRPRVISAVSFRNYPLHLDQIEELGLPKEQYAIAMADTLAFLHWEAEVDARDVEFVLARPRQQQPASSLPSIGSKPHNPDGVFGPHAMWLLDFDCCKRLAMPGTMNDDDEKMQTEVAFLDQVAFCFWRNDPFYPRPPPPGYDTNNSDGNSSNGDGSHASISKSNYHPADVQLWKMFKERYLETSEEILEERGKEEMVRELPGKVMDMIEKTRGKNWFDIRDEGEVE